MCTQTKYSVNNNYQYSAYGNIEMMQMPELQMTYISKNVKSGIQKGETEKEKETEPVKETMTTLIIGSIPMIGYVKRQTMVLGGGGVKFIYLFFLLFFSLNY